MKLVYNVNDKPKLGQLIVFAIQQLLSIMTATLVVPVIINGAIEGANMSSAAALLGAGLGTLVYVAFTKAKSPVFLGSSFAFINSMIASFSAALAGGATMALGFAGLIIGAIFAGLVYVVIAILVKFAGVNWLNKIMPPVVIGPTVAIIGMSLAGNAVGDLVKGGIQVPVDTLTAVIDGAEYAAVAGNPLPSIVDPNLTAPLASPLVALLCGLVTLFITILCSTYGKKTLKLIPFIMGILGGYAFSGILTIIGYAANIDAIKVLNVAPFLALVENGVNLNTFLAVPDFSFMNGFAGISNITPAFIGAVAVAYIPVAFVVFAEHIADHKNISSIIEADLLEEPGLHRTLLGDGIGSMVGAFFGGCPNTTYGESVGCVAITRNASIRTIITAAILAILIAFVSPFIAFVNTIPSCVMGGVCMALYGFIAVSGLKMIQKVDLNQNKNLFVVSVILISGIGGLTLTFGQITITSIACALILGIITNVVVSKAKEE